MTAVDQTTRDLAQSFRDLIETVVMMREAHAAQMARHLPNGAAPDAGLSLMQQGIIVALETILDSEAAVRGGRLMTRLEWER